MADPQPNSGPNHDKGPWYMPGFVYQSPSPTRILLLVLIVALLGLITFVLIRPLFGSKSIDPVYEKLEAVKRIRSLRLVKYHYESVIPVTRNPEKSDSKLEFLLIAPVEISGELDLSQMRYRLGSDSLLLLSLPAPTLSEPYINLRKSREFTPGRGLTLYTPKTGTYESAYRSIRGALEKARRDVRSKAIANGLLEETARKGEDYFRNLAINLGYRVEFLPPGDTSQTTSFSPGFDLNSELDLILEESDAARRAQRRAELLSRFNRLTNRLP